MLVSPADLRAVPRWAGAPENTLHSGPMGRYGTRRTAPRQRWHTAAAACTCLLVRSGENQNNNDWASGCEGTPFQRKTGAFLTGAVKTMLLFPGARVTSCTFSICAPSFIVTVGGLTQFSVSGREVPSWWCRSRWVFLQTTPVELRELSEGLLSWTSSSSNEGPGAAEQGRPAKESPILNSITPGLVRLWALLVLPWVPPWSTSKWMLAASCCMWTEIGIMHLRVSSTFRAAPECTDAHAGWNCSCVSWAKTLILRVALWAGKQEKSENHTLRANQTHQ